VVANSQQVFGIFLCLNYIYLTKIFFFQEEEVSAFEKSGDNIGELKLDGGFSMPKMDTNDDEAFLAPEMNAFGRQFRFLFLPHFSIQFKNEENI